MKVFIASHGKLASGIKSSINILLGEKENITVYDAFIDESNVEEEVSNFLTKISSEKK